MGPRRENLWLQTAGNKSATGAVFASPTPQLQFSKQSSTLVTLDDGNGCYSRTSNRRAA